MIRTPGTIRRTTATLVLAGAVTFGAVALAPAASASESPSGQPTGQQGTDLSTAYLVDGNGGGGPVSFLVTERGRKPIFFCEADKPGKRQNICQPDPGAAPDRF